MGNDYVNENLKDVPANQYDIAMIQQKLEKIDRKLDTLQLLPCSVNDTRISKIENNVDVLNNSKNKIVGIFTAIAVTISIVIQFIVKIFN